MASRQSPTRRTMLRKRVERFCSDQMDALREQVLVRM